MKRKSLCLKSSRPDVKEDRQECVPPPLLALKELDDILVAVLGSQVQRGLPVPVPRLQLHRALSNFQVKSNNFQIKSLDSEGHLCTEQLDCSKIAGDASKVQRRGPEVVC